MIKIKIIGFRKLNKKASKSTIYKNNNNKFRTISKYKISLLQENKYKLHKIYKIFNSINNIINNNKIR